MEGFQKRQAEREKMRGWLHWMVWQAHASEALNLEDFLPAKPGRGRTISAKKNPEAFAAALAKMAKAAERREQRKKKPQVPPLPLRSGRDDKSLSSRKDSDAEK